MTPLSLVTTPTPLAQVIATLERLCPLHVAEAWDNVGLLLAPREDEHLVTTALLTVDLTAPVLDEAIEAGAELVIAYHPPIFAPLRRLGQGAPGTRALLRAVRHGIAIWSPHTALDAIEGGIADWLAGLLGPASGSVPIQPRADDGAVGPGRLVELASPMELDAAVERLKSTLGLAAVRVARGERPVHTVAVCPGAGGSLFEALKAPDLYVTGEMRHHDVLAKVARGASVILTEHTNCERGYLPHFAARISAEHPELRLVVSRRDRDPLQPA